MKRVILGVAVVVGFIVAMAFWNERKEPGYYLELGKAAYEAGKYQEATEYLYKELDVDYTNGEAHYYLTLTYYFTGEYHKAMVQAGEVINFSGNKKDVALGYFIRSLAYREMGKYDEWGADLDKAVEIAPDMVEAICERGDYYYWKRDYDKAKRDYEKVIALDSTNINAHWCKAVAQYDMGEVEEALAEVEYIKQYRCDYEVIALRGKCLRKLGRLAEAMDDAIYCIEGKEDGYEYGMELMKAIADTEYRFVVGKIRAKQEENPSSQTWFAVEAALQKRLGRYEESVASCDKAIVVNPTYYLGYFIRSQANTALGKKEAAIADADKIIQILEGCCEGYYFRAIIEECNGMDAEALKDLDMVVDTMLYEEKVSLMRGNIYWRMGETEKAKKDYQQVVEAYKSNELINGEGDKISLIVAYYRLGETEKAMKILAEVEVEHKGREEYNVARMYSIVGDVEKSIQYLRASIERGFISSWCIRRDPNLENVRMAPEFEKMMGECMGKVER